MKIYAHRGHGLLYPECTRLAYEKALDAGCDGIYAGVHRALDGWMVVCDANLQRLTGVDTWVWDMTCAQAAALSVVHPRPAEGVHTLMPLDDFLDLLEARDTCASLEMVTRMYGGDQRETELAAHISARGLWDRVVLMGYDHEAVVRCRKAVPEGQYGLGMFCQLHHLPGYVQSTGVQHLFMRSGSVRKPLAEAMHALGVKLHAEYVCSTEEALRLRSLGCDVINTPYPQLAEDLAAGRSDIYGRTTEDALATGVPLLNASMSGIDVSQMRHRRK